jgi:hypothetical protein
VDAVGTTIKSGGVLGIIALNPSNPGVALIAVTIAGGGFA